MLILIKLSWVFKERMLGQTGGIYIKDDQCLIQFQFSGKFLRNECERKTSPVLQPSVQHCLWGRGSRGLGGIVAVWMKEFDHSSLPSSKCLHVPVKVV